MNTFTKLSCATAATLLLSGVGSMAAAQETLVSSQTNQVDPFEKSEQNCIDKGWVETKCFTTNIRTGVFPIQLVIDEMNTTIERLRAVNGWGEEVTPKTLVPINSTFAFG